MLIYIEAITKQQLTNHINKQFKTDGAMGYNRQKCL
jgi:hypothetical protein